MGLRSSMAPGQLCQHKHWRHKSFSGYRVLFVLVVLLITINTSRATDTLSSYLGTDSTVHTDALYATICGGLDHSAAGEFPTIGGGENNQAGNAGTTGAFVGGGTRNSGSGSFSVVAGGSQNVAGNYAFIGAGSENEASGEWSVLVGGQRNRALGQYSVVVSGVSNVADGSHSGVIGGDSNTVLGEGSTIFRGNQCFVNGSVSTVLTGFVTTRFTQLQCFDISQCILL